MTKGPELESSGPLAYLALRASPCACKLTDMTNATKTIATAKATERITVRVALHVESGDFVVTTLHGDTAELWDGRSYLTEAAARAAANREYFRLRAA